MKTLFDVIEATGSSLVDDYNKRSYGLDITSNIRTGIPSIDESGYGERGILTITQAQAGEGKSTIARAILEGGVTIGKSKALFFPFEDPEYQIGVSYISKSMNVRGWDLKRGNISQKPEQIIKRVNAATETYRWAESVYVETAKMPYNDMLHMIDSMMAEDPELRLGVVDYLQAFDAEEDEKSVERVVARVTWGLAEICKKYNATIHAFSQVKSNVRDRGKAIFDGYVKNAQFRGLELEPSPGLVIGFRPGKGDGQWSSQLYHYAKDIRSWWRPGRWLREVGFKNYKDNYGYLESTKVNFMPEDEEPLKLAWGSNGISEWKK